jgi:speckle-type POZ protein
MARAFASSAGATSGDELSLTASAIVGRYVGSHILRIDGYSRTKALVHGKFIASEKFVVGGHRWFLEYYPNGQSLNNSGWISFFLNLDYTNFSEAEVRFKISLLDHDGNVVPLYSQSSTPCTFSSRQSSLGYDLIKRSDLEESVYLKDDVFSVRCDVTVEAKEIFTKAIPVPAVRRGV